ncbi:MAG: hypothetical protein D6737_00400 [Chloroflexi bacterium]|nr:MAG: hypothetical protein CUN54_02930 [Phototrophicales bacterium]RMF82826.1 MAG: hypothetical protein D6737_00400 [Chloroflexota bacterium]
MLKRFWLLATLFALLVGGTASSQTARPFMGFAFFPTVFMSSDSPRYVENFDVRADLISIHWGGSVPWEVFAQCADITDCMLSDPVLSATRDNFLQTTAGLAQFTNAFKNDPDKRVYLAINPLNNDRSGVATNYFQSATIPPPSDTFADPQLRMLYRRYADYMVRIFTPDYFSPAIEFNMYLRNNPADFANLISLLQEVRADAQAIDSSLVVAPTIQWEFYRFSYDNDATQRAALDALLTEWHTLGDMFMFSTYPNLFLDLTTLDASHYHFADYGFTFDANTRLMISETGIQPEFQTTLINTLFGLTKQYQVEGIVWFFMEDADAQPFPQNFENIGLFDDAATTLIPHPGLAVWDQWFAMR